jgi:plasmid maintenance system antidote protein VapI
MGEMFNPPHPGLILKDGVLRKDGGVSMTELAEKLAAPANTPHVPLGQIWR